MSAAQTAASVLPIQPAVDVLTELKAAWHDYQDADRRGLAFGKRLYELRKQFSAQGNHSGEGFLPLLQQASIPQRTAYYWIHSFEESIGEREVKPKEKWVKAISLEPAAPADTGTKPPVTFPASFEDFLTRDEADELERNLANLRWVRETTRWGFKVRREVTPKWTAADVFNERVDVPVEDLKSAPEFIQEFARKLSVHTGYDINYVSPNKYSDNEDKMDFHNHKEDHWNNSPVWVVSVGAERKFGMREIANPKNRSSVLAKHGSLITLSPESNWTHEHAVLPDKETKTVRYSLNCKSIPTCAIWDCHSGKHYPPDAVYVGCRVMKRTSTEVLREGTIFGNGTNPLVSHDGALKTEAEFRAYANRKMQDPDFAAQVRALKGKHLLCWCVQSGPKRGSFCHARVWFELANGYSYPVPMSSLPVADLLVTALPADQQTVITDAVNFPDLPTEETAAPAVHQYPVAIKESDKKQETLTDWLARQVRKIALQPYGYYAAKFAKYPEQHPQDIANVEGSMIEIYEEIARLCTQQAAGLRDKYAVQQ